MNTLEEQRKLSESLLAACKAAGIENVKYIAQDKNGNPWHYRIKPRAYFGGFWACKDGRAEDIIAHPPYADDWQDSLMEWVEPQESLSEWKDGFRFTETEKQQIDALADEPLANVLARHPEHIADSSKMVDACDIAFEKFMEEPYGGDRDEIYSYIYRRAWNDALTWWDGGEQASGIESLVCADIAKRQQVGLRKYGVTLENNPMTLIEGLQHLYEELLDAPIYCKNNIVRLIPEFEAMQAERNETAKILSDLVRDFESFKRIAAENGCGGTFGNLAIHRAKTLIEAMTEKGETK